MPARQTATVWATVLTVFLAATGCIQATDNDKKVRPAYMAGSWYPGDATNLAKRVDDLLGQASPPKIDGKPIAVIAPHAGYRFSAPVAANGYRCLQGHTYRRVIGLAFSHRYASTYTGVDVPRELSAYSTPLGQVPLDRQVIDQLLDKPSFVSKPSIDRGEHSLELQLPFLQRVLDNFKLVPLMIGHMTPPNNTAVAQALLPFIDENTLLVASSDFTHFGPNYGYTPFTDDVPNKLRELADQAAKPILVCDFDGFLQHLSKTDDAICGHGPIALLLRILSMQGGAKGVRTAFDTSGQMTNDYRNSVTYQSFILTRRPNKLNEREQRALLRIARHTATAHLSQQAIPEVSADKLPASLRADGACFVTLENHRQLRGCIGNMVADGPLYQAVIRNAVNACRDYRFVSNPVTAEELREIDIEISYLTPMKPIQAIDEIIVGRHGLRVAAGRQRGVLLPQVAYERGWTREVFLAQTCLKARLPTDAWKRADTSLSSFEAQVFGETELATTQPADHR